MSEFWNGMCTDVWLISGWSTLFMNAELFDDHCPSENERVCVEGEILIKSLSSTIPTTSCSVSEKLLQLIREPSNNKQFRFHKRHLQFPLSISMQRSHTSVHNRRFCLHVSEPRHQPMEEAIGQVPNYYLCGGGEVTTKENPQKKEKSFVTWGIQAHIWGCCCSPVNENSRSKKSVA